MKEIAIKLNLSDNVMAYIMNGVMKDTADIVYGCSKKDDEMWCGLDDGMPQDE